MSHPKPPRTAYKFINSRYRESLFDAGTIKIGTAEEFRAADGHSDGRSDPNEGLRVWAPPAGRMLMTPEMKHSLGLPPAIVAVSGPTILFDEGVKLHVNNNCYIYCMSHQITRLMVRRMREQFDCDMAFKITDLRSFFRAVLDSDERFSTESDQFAVPTVEVDRVRYSHVPHEAPHVRYVDHFEKDHRYRWQCELRAAFSAGGPHEPFIVNVPAIRPLIREVRLP